MTNKNTHLRKAVLSLGLFMTVVAPLGAATIVTTTTFASGTGVSATNPDSLTLSRDSVWVAYTNTADSTGKSGNSVVAQYDYTGKLLNQYTFPGYVDGLRYDDERDLIWVMQNQDGNSALVLLDHNAKMTPMSYAVQSATRGYDDVAFINGGIFMSYTNPTGPTDTTLQYLTGVNPITFAPVLTMGATGTNLATQQTGQATAQNDPDSLRPTPLGGLMLSSGDDGQLIFVHNLEQFTRSISFLTILDPSSGKHVSGLDDAVFALAPQGSFYVADTGNNQILKVDVTGVTPMSLYASVGSMNAVVSVDLKTGNATPFITNLKSPHGLAFAADFNSLFGGQ
jgi:hypothetical protein